MLLQHCYNVVTMFKYIYWLCNCSKWQLNFIHGGNMTNEKSEFEISAENLKVIDNAEFVKIVKREPRKDKVYIPITRNGKKAFLVVQK